MTRTQATEPGFEIVIILKIKLEYSVVDIWTKVRINLLIQPLILEVQMIFNDQIVEIFNSLNQGDASRVATHYSDDARLISDHNNIYCGKSQILAALARRLDESPSFNYSVQEAYVNSITSDVMVADLNVAILPGDFLNRWICVVKLVDGDWKIASQWIIKQ